MPSPRVIDLSHWQTIYPDLSGAYAAGIRGVIHKCTEGTGYVDPTLKARHHLAKQAGMLWGMYHFLRPGDMKQQAEWFVGKAKPYMDANTLLAADHEDHGVLISNLLDWLQLVEAMSGIRPILYSGNVLKEQLNGKANNDISSYKLWLADYTPPADLPPGFGSYFLWQYSQKGNIPGIKTGGKSQCDVNDHRGSDAELALDWHGGIGIYPPYVPPVPETVVTVTAPKGVVINVNYI